MKEGSFLMLNIEASHQPASRREACRVCLAVPSLPGSACCSVWIMRESVVVALFVCGCVRRVCVSLHIVCARTVRTQTQFFSVLKARDGRTDQIYSLTAKIPVERINLKLVRGKSLVLRPLPSYNLPLCLRPAVCINSNTSSLKIIRENGHHQ